MTDVLTVLTCVPGKRCAKLYEALDTKPDPFDAGFLFSAESVPVSSLAELAEHLNTLRRTPTAMVIRDGLRAGAVPTANGLYPRRRVDRPQDPAPFEHAEHRWACFDADSTATPYEHEDPTGSVEAWRASLPECLQGAAMVFQFSASQHRSETVRGHAWVWLAEPMGNVPLARWCTRNGLDPSLYYAVQPHYTADPLFAEGLEDPLGERALVVLPGSEAVELDFTAADIEAAHAPGQAGAQRLGCIALEEVGDPSPLEEASSIREKIARQLASAFSKPGKRWDLCGHVGGACVNAGLPPEECCAVLELVRAGDVADRDFGQGLQWALGAWSTTARPLGVKGLAELLGPIPANRVGELLKMLAQLLAEPAQAAPEASPKPADWKAMGFTGFSAEEEPAPLEYIWGPK